MTVDSMRKVDRGVGVPLSFLLIPFVRLLDLFRMGKSKNDVSRTLFIELSEMGSAIIVDPAMRKLKAEGKAELFFLIFSKNYKSLEFLNTVPSRNIFKMESDNLFQLTSDIFRFILWCRKN